MSSSDRRYPSDGARRYAEAHALRPGRPSASARRWFPDREVGGVFTSFGYLWRDHSNRWALEGNDRLVCITGQPYRPRLASYAAEFAAELDWYRHHGFTVFVDRCPSWWNPPLTVLVEVWRTEYAPALDQHLTRRPPMAG